MTLRNGHLDPATMAALVEHRLDAQARDAAMAHLASCADCREVWAETSEMAADAGSAPMSDTPPNVAATPAARSRARWIYAVGGLAAAAAVVIAVLVPRVTDRGDRPELRELVDAVGTNRRTEARLTGGFKWGPVPSVTRGNRMETDAKVELAAANLRRHAERSVTPDALGAAAVASLVVGDVDAAIAQLEQATRTAPDRATLWSDLAAAHLEGYRLYGRSPSAALNAADRALQLRPGLPEALFNRALALTAMDRRDEARAAWQRYVDADPDSGWTAEVRDRARPPS